MAATVSFGGFNLHDGVIYRTVAAMTDAFEPAPRRQTVEPFAARPGGIVLAYPPGPRVINLGGTIGLAGSTWEARRDALLRALAKPRQLLVLASDVSVFEARMARATAQDIRTRRPAGTTYGEWSAEFVCEDPYLRALTPSADVRAQSWTLAPGEVAVRYQQIALTASGSAPAPLRLIVADRHGSTRPALLQVANLSDSFDPGLTVPVRLAVPLGGPVTTQLTVSGNEITDAVRQKGTTGDGLLNDGSFGIYPATVNLESLAGADVSFENGTTGYTTGGTNTIDDDPAQRKFGARSCLATYQNNALLLDIALTLTAAAHSPSRWVYIPTNYDGGGIRLQHANYAGATGTASVDANMGLRDQWQRLTLTFSPVGGDLVGNIQVINTGAAPTAGRFFYVDGCQTELSVFPKPFTIGTRGAGLVRGSVALLDNTQGWVIVRLRPAWSSTQDTGVAFPMVFSWEDDAALNGHRLYYNDTANQWVFGRIVAGAEAAGLFNGTHAALQAVTLAQAWDATRAKGSLDGAGFSLGGLLAPPAAATVPSQFALGSRSDASLSVHGDILWAATGLGTLADADIAAIHAIGNTTPRGDQFPIAARLTGIWSADTAAMETPTAQALVIDNERAEVYTADITDVVGWWPLEDAASPFLDFGGHERDLTVTSAPLARQESAHAGAAVDFDGVDDVLTSSATAFGLTGDLSVCAWVRPDDVVSARKGIISKAGTNQGYALFLEAGGQVGAQIGWGGGLLGVVGITPLLINQEAHVAMTYRVDIGRLRVYVNGALAGQAVVGSPLPPVVSGNVLRVGAAHQIDDGASIWFDGRVAQPAVFARELRPEDVRAIYERGLPVAYNRVHRDWTGAFPSLNPRAEVTALVNTIELRASGLVQPSGRVSTLWRPRYE